MSVPVIGLESMPNVYVQSASLVNDLFACKEANISPFNKLIFKVISLESIKKMFFK